MSAAAYRIVLLILSTTFVVSTFTATGTGRDDQDEYDRGNFRANGYETDGIQSPYYDRSFRGRPGLTTAIISINGRRREIDLRGLQNTASIVRQAEDITSVELIDGPPGFGLFLTSRTDNSFLTQTVNWNHPVIGDRTALRSPSQYAPSSSKTSTPSILLHASNRLFYYILTDPDNQAVTVYQNTNGAMRCRIMDYKVERKTRLITTTFTDNYRDVAKWTFRRRQDVERVAVVEAPRGPRSRCQVSVIGLWIDDFRIGKPLIRRKAGVVGIVCYK